MTTLERLLSRLPGRRAPSLDDDPLYASASAADRSVVAQAIPYTMTGPARLLAVVDAVRHIIAHELPGAFAECGVWRGGSVLAMILTLKELGVSGRDIYLFDTFEGMTTPTERDTSRTGDSALATWRDAARADRRAWDVVFGSHVFNEESVRGTLAATGYPPERLHFVRGAVEDTIPTGAPGELALLRLDTDWYESTHHELVHLYPRLCSSGVLIIDDYGHWQGARQAVEEYFADRPRPFLGRIDYTGRVGVKP
jgi:hypothetical protein